MAEDFTSSTFKRRYEKRQKETHENDTRTNLWQTGGRYIFRDSQSKSWRTAEQKETYIQARRTKEEENRK